MNILWGFKIFPCLGNIYKKTINISQGFKTVPEPWEYLQKDNKYFMGLPNCSQALQIFTKGFLIFYKASKIFLGVGNIYIRSMNISYAFKNILGL